MTIDDKIRDEKLQYDINREAAKISALSTAKIDKYECLTSEEIPISNKRRETIKDKKKIIKSTWRAWKTTNWI